ncbi:hypothetical protein RhiirA1_450378 [Rhizophagus irregularis]|uniref:Uncharacterized protein n=2 Tax=Rhizophagus irregularis TaxID=588596 RepID=A0A2N0SEZ9_9GLOM|nr:hypothetical protein RhiirA1_450378 [Rhizophagus irregularis]
MVIPKEKSLEAKCFSPEVGNIVCVVRQLIRSLVIMRKPSLKIGNTSCHGSIIIISVKFEASLYKKKLRDTNLSKRQNCQEEKEHQKYQVTTNKSEISSDVNNNEDGEAIKIDLKRILDEFLRELEVKVRYLIKF